MNRTNENRRLKTLQQAVKEFTSLSEPSIAIVRKAPRSIFDSEGSLGIFPASFNPPTKAHVALIREARKQAGLDEILILLDLQAMDKRLVGATWEERIAMLDILFRRDPDISIGLSNRGLFFDKLGPLRNLYPPAFTEFIFIVGFDTILRVMDKKYYADSKESLDKLFSQSRFLVANRGAQEEKDFEKIWGAAENDRYRKRVAFFTLPDRHAFLSSSLVRREASEGRPIAGFVPISVLRFIEERGLYTDK
jgi:nicotinic acid mononucleotide adenylyltransferase